MISLSFDEPNYNLIMEIMFDGTGGLPPNVPCMQLLFRTFWSALSNWNSVIPLNFTSLIHIFWSWRLTMGFPVSWEARVIVLFCWEV